MAYSYRQGFYKPKNPEKYLGDVNNIIYRSSWERQLMFKLDMSEAVINWVSEEMPIPYFDSVQGRTRRYFVDFYVTMRTKSGQEKKFAIEVKPYVQTLPPRKPKNRNPKAAQRYLNELKTFMNNQDKWKQAKKYCDENNITFIVLHEKNNGGIF